MFLPFLVQAQELPTYSVKDYIKRELTISAQDWNLLNQGKVVLRDNPDQQLGGIGIIYIQRTPQEVWEVITDYDHYVEFMPETLKCGLEESSGNMRRVYGEYKSTWPFEDIYLESLNVHETSDPNKLMMVWKATRSNMINAYGYWVLKAHKQGTLVFYQTGYEIKWVPKILGNSVSRKRVAGVVSAVKNRLKEKQ